MTEQHYLPEIIFYTVSHLHARNFFLDTHQEMHTVLWKYDACKVCLYKTNCNVHRMKILIAHEYMHTLVAHGQCSIISL